MRMLIKNIILGTLNQGVMRIALCKDSEDIVLLQYEIFHTIDLYLIASMFGEKHTVTFFHPLKPPVYNYLRYKLRLFLFNPART